jgi:ABC-type polysaccharide/polyol phosphate export permease
MAMGAMTTFQREGFELHGETTPLRRLLPELWRARSLVRVLGRKDFFVRYRRPSLGVIWAIVVPVIQAAVLSVVFTVVVRIGTDIPYIVFIMSGIVPWAFFSGTIGSAVRSITSGSGIASKVYFPRAVLPLANVTTAAYGFLPTVVVLLIVALAWGQRPSVWWLFAIPGTIVMVALTAAFALVLAALQVYFRDIAFILGAITQAWFYASGVFFPVDRVPEGILRNLFIANPATGMIEMFRVMFQGVHPYTIPALISTIVWTLALLVFAAFLYRRYDRTFVDLL